ncbi:non-ribosomal peptide synthetase [Sphingomonas sp. H39-1-10]|uniref:non-ribosomal peptide synthetase n=1 Tax=Sphingomonas pollutisoli TaxID=3030829 RepID=UPI0023B97AB3|nr:non-ribosomal peptide synthetase [Sphingomonas pollutisoli]MDF0487297.1 non-ribosomal peptide synthetase [Sphingomonas pollutisoli]
MLDLPATETLSRPIRLRIGEIARGAGAAVAIESPGGSLSYAALDARAAALAGALASRGVTPGATVAVCLPRSAEQIVALLAVWYAGAAYLPLDPAWPEARLAAFVTRAGCAAAIAPRGAAIGTVTPDDTDDAVSAEASDLAYVIFTSGSSGEPKAVEVGHDNLAALVDWHLGAFAIGAGTRSAHLAGLGFDAAAWEIWPTLAAGGTLCLPDDAVRLDPCALRDWLVRERVEVAFAPTALAEPLATMDWPADAPLRVLLTGADKLTVRPKPGQPFTFVNNYGPTECTVVATSGAVAAEGVGLPSIGAAIPGTTIHLLDPAGDAVTPGAPGEIHIGGAQVARGYRGDPALTAARFVTHPRYGRLYRTGDLALRLEDGDYAFLGRVDGQVKVRGHRIEPAEIAAALHRLPEIAASHVLVRDGELVAYVTLNGEVTAGALRAALGEALPDYMVPTHFARLDAMPLTTNGKIDVRALPDPASAALTESTGARAPQTPTELRLFEIVGDVLGHRDFGVDDDFFLLGGHSLLGTQVIIRARDAFGIDLSLFHLFEAATVAKLADVVETLIFAKIAAMSDEDIERLSA